MGALLSITLSEKARQVLANAKAWPLSIMPALAAALDLENELTTGFIQRTRMTGRGPFPVAEGKLGVRSNRLRASLRPARAVIVGLNVESSIGSNVKYAGVHEFGFSGNVTVAAHSRKSPLGDTFKSNSGGAVSRASLIRAGGKINPKRQLTSSVGQVRSHQRHMIMPARAPITRGIQDRLARYRSAVSRAVIVSFSEPAGGST